MANAILYAIYFYNFKISIPNKLANLFKKDNVNLKKKLSLIKNEVHLIGLIIKILKIPIDQTNLLLNYLRLSMLDLFNFYPLKLLLILFNIIKKT